MNNNTHLTIDTEANMHCNGFAPYGSSKYYGTGFAYGERDV